MLLLTKSIDLTENFIQLHAYNTEIKLMSRCLYISAVLLVSSAVLVCALPIPNGRHTREALAPPGEARSPLGRHIREALAPPGEAGLPNGRHTREALAPPGEAGPLHSRHTREALAPPGEAGLPHSRHTREALAPPGEAVPLGEEN